MTSTRRTVPVQPATPQCLHPQCHAQAAHPAPQQPQVQPAGGHQAMINALRPAGGWRVKITKNWIIGILIVIVVGLMGTLSDRDAQIAGLQAKISNGQTVKITTPTERLDYATRICKITHSSATYAQCVINIVGQG